MTGECSKTCGGGVQIDSRGKHQEALFGGEECEGEATRQGECNTDQCPSKKSFSKMHYTSKYLY